MYELFQHVTSILFYNRLVFFCLETSSVGNLLVWGVISQRYLFNANPDTKHNANPTDPNSNSKW